MSTALIIPARGGSKSIPLKNIKPFCGRPLLFWMCFAGEQCAGIDSVHVATEDDRIADFCAALPFDKLQVFDRSALSATDTAPTEDVLLEFATQRDEDCMILGQCTSPLTTAADFAGALDRIDRTGADTLLTVARQKRFFWEVDGQGLARPLNYDPRNRPRRQDFAGQLVENGAFYIFGRQGLLDHKCRLYGRIAAYEMGEQTLVEIDEPDDWILAESLFNRHCADVVARAESLGL